MKLNPGEIYFIRRAPRGKACFIGRIISAYPDSNVATAHIIKDISLNFQSPTISVFTNNWIFEPLTKEDVEKYLVDLL